MNRKAWLIAAASLVAGVAQATCYSVYKADGTLLQETSTTPVDLRLPIGDTVPVKFGEGASMTISESGFYCPDRTEASMQQDSLAQAVRAEEKKLALAKPPAAAQERIEKQQLVKQQGNVLKIKEKPAP